MVVETLRVVDYSDLFRAVRERFPHSEAENKFIEGAEDYSIRRFYAPDDKQEEANFPTWQVEMFTTLQEEIGMTYGDVIGVEIYY